MNKMQPSERTLEEVTLSIGERFYKKYGYYPTEEDAIRLTDEARKAIKAKKEKNNEHE